MKHIKLFENFLNEKEYTAGDNKEYAKYLMDAFKDDDSNDTNNAHFKEVKRYYETGHYGSESSNKGKDMRPKEVQIAGDKFWLTEKYKDLKRTMSLYGAREIDLLSYEEYFKEHRLS